MYFSNSFNDIENITDLLTNFYIKPFRFLTTAY